MSYPARQGSYHSGWWDVFAELDAMRRRLEQLFPGGSPQGGATGWAGGVTLVETGEGWVLEAALPGVPPEAVDVDLTDRELTIRGEARQPEAGTAGRRFDYRVPLPGEVVADQVEAALEHGVLTVKLPRVSQAPGRKIPIESAGGARTDPDTAAGQDTATGQDAGTDHGAGARTSADEHPTEPLPRTRSTSQTTSSGEPPTERPAPLEVQEPTTAPPYGQPAAAQPGTDYLEPDYSESPDESATGRFAVPEQEPHAGYQARAQESAAPDYLDESPFFPWPNHSRSDQDHPT